MPLSGCTILWFSDPMAQTQMMRWHTSFRHIMLPQRNQTSRWNQLSPGYLHGAQDPRGKVGKAEGWSAQGLLSPACAHVPAVMPAAPYAPMESISEFEDLH